jgi:hypothetical protein
VVAAHRQAWEVSGLRRDDAWRQVLEEPDPVKRVALGDRVSLCDADLSRLVTQALGAAESDARRVGLATAMFLGFSERRNLTPAAWEPLGQHARRVLEPRSMACYVQPGARLTRWREICAFLEARCQSPPPRLIPQGSHHCFTVERDDPPSPAEVARMELEASYLKGGFPELWEGCDWQAALRDFQEDLSLFHVLPPEGMR